MTTIQCFFVYCFFSVLFCIECCKIGQKWKKERERALWILREFLFFHVWRKSWGSDPTMHRTLAWPNKPRRPATSPVPFFRVIFIFLLRGPWKIQYERRVVNTRSWLKRCRLCPNALDRDLVQQLKIDRKKRFRHRRIFSFSFSNPRRVWTQMHAQRLLRGVHAGLRPDVKALTRARVWIVYVTWVPRRLLFCRGWCQTTVGPGNSRLVLHRRVQPRSWDGEWLSRKCTVIFLYSSKCSLVGKKINIYTHIYIYVYLHIHTHIYIYI